MDEKKKKELFPYFAYLYSQKLNPERYGKAKTIEEWSDILQENTDDVEQITAAAGELSDEDWDSLAKQYEQVQSNSDIELAKKGTKLKMLKSGSNMKPKKKRKCSCGCDLILSKTSGGKLTETCSCKCGGKLKKKAKKPVKAQEGAKLPDIEIDPKFKDNSAYKDQRYFDSIYQRDYGIKSDISTILNSNGTFLEPKDIREAENFGYIGIDEESIKRFLEAWDELYENPYNLGAYRGKQAGTEAYLKSNKPVITNNQVVQLAELIKNSAGLNKDLKFGEGYDLKKMLNSIDLQRVLLELNRITKK